MLAKLLKYEIKAMSRSFLPLYGALLIVSVFVNLGMRFPRLSLLLGLSGFVLVALLISLIVITLMAIIQRFKNNLLSNEGYLMFTLPVSAERLILSKLIAAMLWIFLSCMVSVLSFFIIALNAEFVTTLRELIVKYSYYINLIQKENVALAALIIASITSQLAYFILVVYCSLSISQMAVFTKRRGAISFLAFIVITVIINTFVGEMLSRLFPSIPGYDVDSAISMLSTALIINTSLSIIIFFITGYLLRRHLNLD